MRKLLKTIGLVVIPGAVPAAACGYAISWMIEKHKNNNKL
jgi:hypothetical protein